MSATGFGHGSLGAVVKMDEVLGQVDRLLRQMARCPGGEHGYTLCQQCRTNAQFMRARIREVRGFAPEEADHG